MLNRLEVDQAVFFAVATRGWQFLAGPITLLLITRFFSPEIQGYFYTFASLMGVQTLVELGLHSVIIAVASHEWAGLSLDAHGRVTGDEASLARLAGLRRAMARWYAVVSVLFVAGTIGVGWWLFSRQPDFGIDWQRPWLALVLLNGLLIWLWPLTAILEGCNQIKTVNRVRLAQALMGNLAVWLCMGLGAGLWTAVVSTAVRLVWELGLVMGRYGAFFRSIWNVAAGPAIDWWGEVWPLQWRIAVRSAVGYLASGLYTLVMFDYFGPDAAGRMGMTWSAILALEAAALAWVQTRVPLFGMLVARRDYAELDRVFFRLLTIACLMCAAGAAALCTVVAVLPSLPFEFAHKIASRMLPLRPTALFCLGTIILMIPRCFGAYLFSHKRDPYVYLSLFASGMNAPVVWWAGRNYGADGMAAGFLCVVVFLVLPVYGWIWQRCRREWHSA